MDETSGGGDRRDLHGSQNEFLWQIDGPIDGLPDLEEKNLEETFWQKPDLITLYTRISP